MKLDTFAQTVQQNIGRNAAVTSWIPQKAFSSVSFFEQIKDEQILAIFLTGMEFLE